MKLTIDHENETLQILNRLLNETYKLTVTDIKNLTTETGYDCYCDTKNIVTFKRDGLLCKALVIFGMFKDKSKTGRGFSLVVSSPDLADSFENSIEKNSRCILDFKDNECDTRFISEKSMFTETNEYLEFKGWLTAAINKFGK